MIDCEVTGTYHCLQYKSVSNLLPTFVTATPKKSISVVEQSMVNMIVGADCLYN